MTIILLILLVTLFAVYDMTRYITRGNATSEQYWDTAVHPQRKGY